MKRIAYGALVLAALALLAAPVASAGTPLTVRLPPCLGNGQPGSGSGQRTVPAGSEITIAAAYASKSRGEVMRLVDATEIAAAIDGVPIGNPVGYWFPIAPLDSVFPSATGPGWIAEWEYDTGITLQNPGDQMVVYFSWVLDSRIRDVGPPSSGGGFLGPGEVWTTTTTCTITAA